MELAEYVKKLFIRTKEAKQTRRATSESAELRLKIAALVGRDIKQIAGLTRGWSNYQLLRSYEDAIAWKKNPAACWWVIYKKNKQVYGRRRKETIGVVGKTGRHKNEREARQQPLF